MQSPFWVVFCVFASAVVSHASTSRSLVTNSKANNRALLVAAANGLSGLDYDIKNLQDIGSNADYAFKDSVLLDDNASVAGTKAALAKLAEEVDADGTLFFYFTGHGTKGGLYMGDQKFLHVSDIREAIELGRQGKGPVSRLVIMYDSCFSGSMVDPVLRNMFSDELLSLGTATAMADELVQGLQTRGAENYWSSLFVFASSLATETSLASAKGSIFTLALKQAFEETVKANGTMATLVELTKKYTKGHHPIERFVPATMKDENILGHSTR